MQQSASTSTEAQTSIIFADHLPLQLIKSEAIPPAPTRSESAIDWSPDFAGYSWIAYGASSLLVISHFPNPLSEEETLIGPIFRQIFELSIDGTGTVSAVSWSPAMPSAGDLAAALDNCIGLFSHNSDVSKGSFCWSQAAILVQSTKVEAIKWTGSGDGIITGGVEVFLWRKKGRSWGMAWKFRQELPQTLVSATWSIEGPSATAPLNKQQIQGSVCHISEASKCVSVCHSDGKFKYVKTELRHPLPVSMIQWRPSTGKQLKNEARHPVRQVLLTCCVDGTVRLWSEIDDGRVRKIGNENNDQKTTKLSFRVAAVIEINQELNGTLGSDIFVRWAAESDGIINTGKGTNQYFSLEGCQHGKTGKCEWLVGFGPKMLVTFWAIHCLDDIAPLRFPRVTLWKRQELVCPKVENSSLVLDKVVILRNQVFGPPSVCSLVRSLPPNSLAWSQLYTHASSSIEDESLNKSEEENLSCAGGILNIDGHTGNILQVAVHPSECEVEVAASLDTDGLVLFWSISTISNCIMGLPTLNPAWEFLGKIVVEESYLKYTCLRWAPTVLDEDWVIFAGHAEGVDCFIIKISEGKEKKISSHKLCTIPFITNGRVEGPTTISSVPLSSTCKKTFVSNDFMLLALWKEAFKVFSWKITIHPCNFSGSCRDCSFDIKNTDENSMHIFESTFDAKKYCIAVDPCSSVFPDPHNHDQVTSYAVFCPTSFILSEEQKWVSDNEKCGYYSTYHMVTGLADGTLKLWRSMPAKPPNLNSGWDLVGILAAHDGPIVAISLTGCGRKIATICPAGQSNTSSTLHIWESLHLAGAGIFILEDKLFLNGEVISLNWLTMGNGQLVLGVCLQNELRVYAQRRCVGQNLVKSGKSLERNIWFCIALTHTYPPICDFLWGPKATAVVVHNDYFCLFSQWLFLADKKHQGKFYPQSGYNGPLNYNGGSDKNMLTAIFTDAEVCGFKETSMEDNDKKCLSRPPEKMSMKNEISSSMLVMSFQQKNNSDTKLGYWSMLEVAERFGGSLPVYHPEALLDNICSGNWKRAYIALRHLVEYLTSTNASVEKSCSTKSSSIIPPVHLSNYLEGLISTSKNASQLSGDASLVASSSQLLEGLNQFGYSWGADASNGLFSSSSIESELSGFIEPLEKKYAFAAITDTEKMQILAIIDLLHEISNQQHSASAYKSLDEPGQRFWVAVRFQQLYFVRRFGRLPSVGELVIDSAMIGWAFHSDCQENLFDSLLPNQPSWHDMQKMGVGFWYTNATQLRSKMEKLARQQYLKLKDPKDCALLYIALNRLQVLAGLFKISKDDKDKPLVGFLSRNFQEAKNKAAALKNAYVLLGRHQVELAIAFFLLGGDTTSAITVCANNLGDKQLALVICRLVEGYGGPLERHLVSKLLLPSAIENADYWFASFLEWLLGNHSRAFLSMLGVEMDSLANKPTLVSNHASFLDPSIGRYCLMLATQSSMKNAVGERNAAILGRWAILMSATALNRCGLPLEALACLSSSLGIFGGSDQGSVSDTANAEVLNKIVRTCSANSSSNWILGDVAFQMELHAKLDLAMQYISKLLREHPSWPYTSFASPGACTFSVYEIHQDKTLLEDFEHKLITVLAYFEQKFSLIRLHLINRIVILLCNNGLVFIGYHILQGYISKDPSQDKRNALGDFVLNCILPNLLLKTAEEISYLFSRYIVACSITCPELKSYSSESCVVGESKFGQLAAWGVYVHDLIRSLWSLRAALKLFCVSCAEDFTSMPFFILDLCEYYVYFASTWLQGNHKGVVLIMKPHLITANRYASYGMDKEDLHKLLPQIAELMISILLTDDLGDAVQITKPVRYEHGDIGPSIPEDERWKIIWASLWGYMSSFLKHRLDSLPEKLEQSYSFPPLYKLFSFVPDSNSSVRNSNNIHTKIRLVSVVLSKFLKTVCAHICSYRARQFASFLLQKVVDGLSAPTLLWLEEFSQAQSTDHHKHFIRSSDTLDMLNNENELSASEILWDICADPELIYGGLSQENFKWSEYIMQKHSNGWNDVSMSIMGEHEAEEREVKDSSPPKKFMLFQTPKEIYTRNGELLEALCINSFDQQEAALASNKKGIIFFSWKDGLPCRDKPNYIWAEVDWPHNGWAGCESTPVPTCVSPGVGLGNKKGAHLGLGGATVGVGSLARTGRDLTGGEAIGIPGYAGIGAAALGWGIQEDFEVFVDPPATVENITTRAFSSHPSRPFFLVGSSNTHIYLWEFGKDKATATYGVLPAANVPPPFALASISSVQFDHCGHRFATAALDGTVCTWQLEVGGRSNVRPTESSLCFTSHALDVTYVTASGSIIAAAGYSSNGINVVIWDTLAPPTTSRASIMCHEGGARSLFVFDNDIGSGSISPLIVTGGKGGDVGLHDFRFVATGKAKRHKHSISGEQNINASTADMWNKIGDQNANGMLWYIPKAHSGSVTKIATIPNTSFFLTGGKDGDVKLWDAKRANLVYHWPKLHERRTFLQPSSRGFGGVVQAAVTDVQVVSHGFLTCGGDGSVKLIQLKDFPWGI